MKACGRTRVFDRTAAGSVIKCLRTIGIGSDMNNLIEECAVDEVIGRKAYSSKCTKT